MWRIVAVSIVLFLVSGCGKKIDIASERAALLATDVEFSKRSVEVGAAEAFHFFLAEDAIQLPAQSNPIVGRDSIYERMKSEGGNYVLRWEPKTAEVAQSGELGYTWGTYTLSFNDSTGMKTVYGKYVNVWRKQPGGLWKAIIDIGNQSPVPEKN